MASHARDWEKFFKEDKFTNQYKTGEQITGQFAKLLIDQSGLVANSKANPDSPLVVLDNACGTGIVSSILQHELGDQAKSNLKLTCGDISQGMLDYVNHRIDKENWQNVEVKTVDAQDSGLPSSYFTHVIASFVFMALPKSLDALDDSTRILQPGGTIGLATWIEPGWASVMQKAIETIPGNLPFPTPQEFVESLGSGQWNSVSWIELQLKERGFEDINVRPVTKSMSIKVPNLLEMSMIMFAMVSKVFWTEKQREEDTDKVRPALERYLETTYGKEGDVPMEWTAIVSTARKPN
ncbi:Acetylaranotin bis-thiomethyltransferase [Penicillium cataractarum]|uniref:Acetylaranotin bis-thiomethyltransferase n=1 Tax=Penicillium cataractarum TaxID=2100454 RepID=A0A9W9RPF6_9EURO|nr:Acetylaranotin bis-thiomethyltransferase [Penicillium cataractarum]KAJ5363696.1 Acetylaranotin bis-thiomethyltransferase [Penicillium cataractarum]